MLTSNRPTLGNTTQSRTAIALFAATLLIGGSVTEASAKSRITVITPASRLVLARRQRRDRPVVGLRAQLLRHGLLLRQ